MAIRWRSRRRCGCVVYGSTVSSANMRLSASEPIQRDAGHVRRITLDRQEVARWEECGRGSGVRLEAADIITVPGVDIDLRCLVPEPAARNPQLTVRGDRDVAYCRQRLRIAPPPHDFGGRHRAVGHRNRHALGHLLQRAPLRDASDRRIATNAQHWTSVIEYVDYILSAG